MHQHLAEINQVCFSLYNFSEEDRNRALKEYDLTSLISESDLNHDYLNTTLSWAAGVAFGRFKLGDVMGSGNIGPFDSLIDSSPAMVSENEGKFHSYNGVLVDEVGHKYDLTTLIENILDTFNIVFAKDVRAWVRKDFFGFHLGKYSKSRRQAPIFWPLQTETGMYTLWIDYHSMDAQTPFTCVNDFIDPKIRTNSSEISKLTSMRSRSVGEEKQLSSLVTLDVELKNFRDELLEIAIFWRPHLTDGVLLNAAPLWSFFQHKPWKENLKKAWEELEKGKYEWSQMAFNIWPERVFKKCHQDRSVAIAHDVLDELWEEIEVPAVRGKGIKLVWQPKEMTEYELDTYIQQKIAQG
jgi:hypothetical protein